MLSRKRTTATVRSLVLAWKRLAFKTAQQINEGWCGTFAESLSSMLPGSRVIWNEDFDHAYVRYRGRLYDAEAPRGVRDYRSLPCIKRQKI